MGKPYSMDLRTRVVAAVEGGLSRNEAAQRFNVAISTAINWVRRKEETAATCRWSMPLVGCSSLRPSPRPGCR